ncbi:MAG TPA: hypothetical protein VHT28_07030 [Silvibacterium sp.]|nr:hypothetical protein [Silvibacterium sp.]
MEDLKMPKASSEGTGAPKKKARRSRNDRSERIEKISKSSSQIVRDAAALLDEEISAGIVAAKQIQERFQKDRRVDVGDFKKALEKFQADAHEVVNLLNTQISEARSQENTELANRLLQNAHSAVDIAVEMVNMGAEIADELAQAKLKQKANTRTKRSR